MYNDSHLNIVDTYYDDHRDAAVLVLCHEVGSCGFDSLSMFVTVIVWYWHTPLNCFGATRDMIYIVVTSYYGCFLSR